MSRDISTDQGPQPGARAVRPAARMERRSFLQLAALAGGGLMLGVFPGCASPQLVRMRDAVRRDGSFAPNVFLSINPQGRVLVAMNKSEMGQGVMTAAAVLIAEELEVPLASVEPFHATRPEFATSSGEVGGTPAGLQITGGSSSTPENFLTMRRAGAAAREMLITAAARKWGVPRAQCRAEAGAVVHQDGRKLPYSALTRAAAQVEPVADPPLKQPAQFKLIGKDVTRVDARMKVDGSAIYGADFTLPNMVRALVIRPPVMGARVATLDAAQAKQLRGVVDIFAFERGVAVVAEKFWQARAAAQQVRVTWSGGTLRGLNTTQLRRDALARLNQPAASTIHSAGDVEAVIGRGDVKKLDVVYEAPYLAHAPMEPMNCTVWARDGRAQVWAPNQSPTLMAEGVARTLGIDRSAVQVETLMLGGGFGRRGVPDFAVEAAMIARRVPRPVQLIWTREDDTQGGYYRPAAFSRMRGAVDRSGRALAMSYHGISQSILADQGPMLGAIFPEWMPTLGKRMMARAGINLFASGSVPDVLATEGITDSPYAIAAQQVQYTPITTKIPIAFWRSVGHSFNGFFVESFMDELAHLAGADPFTFRAGLLKRSPRHLAVLREAARLGKWGTPIERGWGRGIAVHKSFGSIVAHVVEAGVVDGRIKVRRVSSAVDCGLAITPDMVRAQIESAVIFGLSAAIDQRIDLVDGVVQQGNFDTYPVLRMFEAPHIEVSIIPSAQPPTGIGEPGLPPVTAALGNALFKATGVRLRRMPLQQEWNARARTP